MSRNLLLTIVVLGLICAALGKSNTRQRQQKRTLDDQLDGEAAHWVNWLSTLNIPAADQTEISTILVNHRMDVKALTALSDTSYLTNIGINQPDARAIWDKAHVNATSTNATAAAAPFTVSIQIILPTSNATANATTSVPTVVTPAPVTTKRRRSTKRDVSSLQQWLSGVVNSTDIPVVAAALEAHRLNTSDLANVTKPDLMSIGIAMGDAMRIVSKAQQSVAASTPAQSVDVAATANVTVNSTAATTAQTILVSVTILPTNASNATTLLIPGNVTMITRKRDAPAVSANATVNATANATTAGVPITINIVVNTNGTTLTNATVANASVQSIDISNNTINATVIVSNATVNANLRRRRALSDPIDRLWLRDCVVDPRDVDTIYPIMTAHRISTVSDLLLLSVKDLVGIGCALGDAGRIMNKANLTANLVANATATNATASVQNLDSLTNNTVPVVAAATANASTPGTVVVSVTIVPPQTSAKNLDVANSTVTTVITTTTTNSTAVAPANPVVQSTRRRFANAPRQVRQERNVNSQSQQFVQQRVQHQAMRKRNFY